MRLNLILATAVLMFQTPSTTPVGTGPSLGLPNVKVMVLDTYFKSLTISSFLPQGVSGLSAWSIQWPAGWSCADYASSAPSSIAVLCSNLGSAPTGGPTLLPFPSIQSGQLSCIGYTNAIDTGGNPTATTLLCDDITVSPAPVPATIK